MHVRLCTSLVACGLTLVSPMIPRAAASPLMRSLLGRLNPGSGLELPAARPLSQRAIRHMREAGFGKKIIGSDRSHYVAFTFDDGPSGRTTPTVLAALEKYDIPATFFVVGWRLDGNGKAIRKNRELLAEMIRRGHMVGNHTYRHKNIRRQSRSAFERAIYETSDVIARQLGQRAWWFRPPYGAMKAAASEYLEQEGYTEVLWSIDSNDWRTSSGDRLRRRIRSQIKSKRGGVVLFHDTKKITARNIGLIFEDLLRENCARLETGKKPIIPVSLHYFIREKDGTPRPIPGHVAERTARYVAKLPGRCKAHQAKTSRPPARADRRRHKSDD